MIKEDKFADNMFLEPTPGMPRYEQVKQAVRRYIKQQNLKTGDKLPPETELCKQFDLSRVTVNKALNELAWEGVVKRVRGSGTYIGTSRLQNRIMVCSPTVSMETDFCSALFTGIREEASSQKVDIVYETHYTVPSVEVINKANVDGVLTLYLSVNDLPAVLNLYRAGVNFVCLALRDRAEPLPTVCTNNYESMTEAVNYLIDQGHSRISYITCGAGSNDVTERIIAFSNALSAAKGHLDPAYLLMHTNYSIDTSRLRSWWNGLPERPTAIVFDAFVSNQILQLMQSLNLRIPDDVSLLVVDDLSANRHIVPKLTTVRQPVYELGRRGISKLMQMLRGEDDGKPEILSNEFVLGDSVQKLK